MTHRLKWESVLNRPSDAGKPTKGSRGPSFNPVGGVAGVNTINVSASVHVGSLTSFKLG